jgi:dipeptidyl aminopeptidase/acylaminoacyl peptidase
MNREWFKNRLVMILLVLGCWPRFSLADTSKAIAQEPQKPYPYREEQVSIAVGQGITLAGTLTLPQGGGPFPVVLLLAGSGPADRDETFGQHHPLLVYADTLTRKGIAALRYDKRGVGASTGHDCDYTFDDDAQDAMAAVAFLQARKDIDPQKIGLMGTSEGGITAYILAARSKNIAFIVMLGSPCLDGERSMFLQHSLVWKANGLSDRAVSIQANMEKDCVEDIKYEKDEAKGLEKIKKTVETYLAKMTDEDQKELKSTLDTVDQWGKALESPYWRCVFSYDPQNDLRKVKCPVLAVWGDKDLQVPPSEHGPALEAIFKESKNADYTLKVFPGVNHAMQHCKTGSPAEFVGLPETVAPEVLDLIRDWIDKHTK